MIRFLCGAFLALMAIQPKPVSAEVNSLDIIEASLNFQCMNWRPTGVCFWLKCRPFPPSCEVRTSMVVKHYTPDFVVSSYQRTGKNPWAEFRLLSEATTFGLEGGQGGRNQRGRSSSLKYKNVDVAGNPLATVWQNLGLGMGLTCKSAADSFMPYFISTLDTFSWRFPYVETLYPASWVKGMREVGDRRDGQKGNVGPLLLMGGWGGVHPRTGHVIQSSDYQAAAIMATRAVDIVTRSGQPHVYNPITTRSRQGWWPPGESQEWSSKSGYWQMLYPRKDSSCHLFGHRGNQTMGTVHPYSDRESATGDYVWLYWRPYECCEKKGQILIAKIAGE